MRFFRDRHGDLWPVSKIERVVEDVGIEIRHVAHLIDGAKVELRAGEFENLRRIGAPFFGATPGHYVIHLDFDTPGNDPVFKTPVVGWVHDPDGGLLPVTGDGINDGTDGGDSLPIMYPDGTIKRYSDQLFATIDEFIDNERKT